MPNSVITRREVNKQIKLSETIHPLLRRIYIARGITSDDQLDNSTQALLDYHPLANIKQATELLYQTANAEKKILIVGDFDTDGATSTALIMTALREFGVKNVSYIIPDRFEDGYGLSISVVERAIAQQASLIITVDNGISATEAVDYAKQHDIKVIITDHHLPPEILPDADAIINPNLQDCPFPSKNLAGVGVTFYFMSAFRALLRQNNWFEQHHLPEYKLGALLDLVALGTVADVVTLDQNNRILIQQGLKRIQAGYCCAGIKALITIAGRNIRNLTAQDLSFYLAPRLNAAGRINNMSLSVELLLTKDDKSALKIAEVLESLNSERKMIEQTMQQEALSFIDKLDNNSVKSSNSFVIYHPEFHQGVIGVLSSRIKDKLYRPVISFAKADNGFLKGSGRSINNVHLRNILETIHNRYPKLITCFGGHAMAAGLTIPEENLNKFSHYFEEEVNNILKTVSLKKEIMTDGEIDSHHFNLATAKILREGGPWGANFPEPLFDGEFLIHQQKRVKNNHLSMVLEPLNGGQLLNAIAFNVDLNCWPDQSIKKIKAVYQLEISEFRGNETINLLIRHLWPIS